MLDAPGTVDEWAPIIDQDLGFVVKSSDLKQNFRTWITLDEQTCSDIYFWHNHIYLWSDMSHQNIRKNKYAFSGPNAGEGHVNF